MPESIDLTPVIRAAVRQGIATVHTLIPGSVVSYDRTTQKAEVQPCINGRWTDGETIEPYAFPVLPGVPVVFPSASGVSLTFDLAAGDPVMLFCAERSTDEWRATGETDITPADLRRFSLADAFAVPGGLPGAIPAAGYASGATVLRGDDLRLGSSSAVEPVLLQATFETQLQAFLTAFQVFNTAVSAAVDPVVANASAAFAPSLATWLGQVTAGHGATKVKAE